MSWLLRVKAHRTPMLLCVYSLNSRFCCPFVLPVGSSTHDQISSFPGVWVKATKRLEMNNLTSVSFEYDDDAANKKKLENLWGNSLNKLTPKQRQLVVEILSNLSLTGSEA